jgi:hypothetical protein
MAAPISISSIRPSAVVIEVDYDVIGTFETSYELELRRITDTNALAIPVIRTVLERGSIGQGKLFTRRRLVARLEVTTLQLQVRLKINTPTPQNKATYLRLRNVMVFDDFGKFGCFEEELNPGVLGSSYRGKLNTTASGYTCQVIPQYSMVHISVDVDDLGLGSPSATFPHYNLQ